MNPGYSFTPNDLQARSLAVLVCRGFHEGGRCQCLMSFVMLSANATDATACAVLHLFHPLQVGIAFDMRSSAGRTSVSRRTRGKTLLFNTRWTPHLNGYALEKRRDGLADADRVRAIGVVEVVASRVDPQRVKDCGGDIPGAVFR